MVGEEFSGVGGVVGVADGVGGEISRKSEPLGGLFGFKNAFRDGLDWDDKRSTNYVDSFEERGHGVQPWVTVSAFELG